MEIHLFCRLELNSCPNLISQQQCCWQARNLWHPQTKSGAKLFIILGEILRGGIWIGSPGGRTIQTDFSHTVPMILRFCFNWVVLIGEYLKKQKLNRASQYKSSRCSTDYTCAIQRASKDEGSTTDLKVIARDWYLHALILCIACYSMIFHGSELHRYCRSDPQRLAWHWCWSWTTKNLKSGCDWVYSSTLYRKELLT